MHPWERIVGISSSQRGEQDPSEQWELCVQKNWLGEREASVIRMHVRLGYAVGEGDQECSRISM